MEIAEENKIKTQGVTKYESYKDSGVEWLGEIPEHWEVIRLGFLGEFSASGIDKYLKKSESLVKIINFTDVYGNSNKIIDSSFNFMEVTTPEENRKKHLVKKGDMIFLPSSETYEDLGLSALVNEDLENTSFSYHVIRLVLKCDIAHSFRKYFTNNAFVLKQFARQGKGSTRKIIGRSVFKNIIVAIPPIQEQNAIANFLDKKTALIDQAVGIKEKQIELLKERRQILIHKAVTKGVDKSVKLKDSGVEWIGDIPEGWEVKRLKYILKSQGRIGFKGYTTSDLVDKNEGALTLGASHLNWEGQLLLESPVYISWRKYFESPEIMVSQNDIIIVQRGSTCGKVALIKENLGATTINPSLVLLKEIKESPEYVFLGIKIVLDGILNLVTRTAIPMLTQFQINNIEIAIPPFIEQEKIVSHIVNKSGLIDIAISLKEKEIEKLKEYKASLINSAVTGKVRVK